MPESDSTEVVAAACEDWVVIIEASAEPAWQFHEVKDLITQLQLWQATGLFSRERYAVQLRAGAPSHHEALTIALAAHDRAVKAMGGSPPTLLRVEVLTVGELKLSTTQTAAEAPSGRTFDALIPTALYEATRALLQANSRAEIDEVLTAFVLAAGGTVNIGELGYFPGQVSVDLGLSPTDRMFATADAASVSGLIIEQSLPALVHDAERMLARLHLADQAPLR